jgi:hypothetical protein
MNYNNMMGPAGGNQYGQQPGYVPLGQQEMDMQRARQDYLRMQRR